MGADSQNVLQELDVDAPDIVASGGGAYSPLWLQIQADILQKPVQAYSVSEQACLGACILAGASTGIFGSMQEGCRQFVTMQDKV